jgi:lipopolysaccharide transport system ATP-binding protein
MTAVIRVENLGKRYTLRHERGRGGYRRLSEELLDAIKRPFKRANTAANNGGAREEFWALKDVSFEVKQGAVLGIIGRNGAGKSTLLRILSRITEPTEGRARIKGRVASLLEVGTGFHPELTGRENIFLNGAILGMSRSEIRRKFDEIVSFAEVEKFLDTPVKRYSSGMYVRLAFAVAAHLEPEILVVDEVLAVGDSEFQKRCLGKMRSVALGEGRTVLFVSHNMAAIEGLCSSALLVSSGRMLMHADVSSVIRSYLEHGVRRDDASLLDRKDREGTGWLRFSGFSLADAGGEPVPSFRCGVDSSLLLRFENRAGRELRNVRLAVGVDDEFGKRVLLLDSHLVESDFDRVPVGEGSFRINIPRMPLLPGRYQFTIFATVNGVIADWLKQAATFDVEGGDYFGTGHLPPPGQGMFVTPHSLECEPG